MAATKEDISNVQTTRGGGESVWDFERSRKMKTQQKCSPKMHAEGFKNERHKKQGEPGVA